MVEKRVPKLVFCYTPEDALFEELLEYYVRGRLATRVNIAHAYQVIPGQNWLEARKWHFDTAHVIILLISPNFLASDLCLEEAALVRQRYETKEAIVMAVLLKPCFLEDLEDIPILQGIPVLSTTEDLKSSWHERVWEVTTKIYERLPPAFFIDPEIELMYCYAREDEKLRDALAKYLQSLQRERSVKTWHDREILPGMEYKQEIDLHLHSADIILLLVSPHFMASRYCYTIEMQRTLERHRRKDARVIPVILSPIDWQTSPLGILQALPRDGKPITTWRHRGEAFFSVLVGICDVIEAHTQSLLSNNTIEEDKKGY
jgi:hypothetical protein